jgi:hypothetical protein
MTECDKKNEAYQASVSLVVASGDEIWQTISAFLVTHSIFMGFLLSKELDSNLFEWRPGAFIACIIGLLLCALWAIAFSRNIAYYRFRIAQARYLEPEGYRLIAGNGHDFAEGNLVNLGQDRWQMPWLARTLRAAGVVRCLIGVFGLGYLGILAFTGPWWWVFKIIRGLFQGAWNHG